MKIETVHDAAIDKEAFHTVMALESPTMQPVIGVNMNFNTVAKTDDVGPVIRVWHTFSRSVTHAEIADTIRADGHP